MTADGASTTDASRDHDARRFRVLAVCGSFAPGFRGGGPIRSVARIIDTVSEHVDVTLLTRDRDLGCRDPYPGLSGRWVDRDRTRVFYLNTGSLSQWLRLWRDLRAAPFDLLYVNSLWSPQFTQIPVLAVRLGLIRAGQVLLAPRGELSPGALSLKSWKKRLFLKWWGPFLKRMGVVWHATADKEASEIRAVCPWADIEINQNQVALPPEPLSPAAHDGPPRLVFISRVSPKKNLDLVLHALNELSMPVEFDIYGPLEDTAHWKHCEALISQLSPSVRVRYRGEVSPEDVRRTFGEYDAFAFPTRGENFGHVIAESLSASCPVICSDKTPWTKVLESGGGSVVRDLTAQALAKELERITAMTPDERLRTRYRAGEAYRSWRRQAPDQNILDLARQTLNSIAR